MLTRRILLSSTAVAVATPQILSDAMAATPKNIVVMAKTIDDIVSGFDPAEAYEGTNFEICGNLYRTLVTVDPADSTKLVGDLAETWEVSPDGLNLTFQIRKGVTFESGKPVTADDAAFSLQRAVKLNKAPSALLTQFGWTADNVEMLIRADGLQMLLLTLPKVWASGIVLSSLSTVVGCVVEKAAALTHEDNGDLGNKWLKTHSAGAGSYRLVEWLASDRVVLEANPNASVKPRVPRVVMRHVTDPAIQLLLLQKGDVDIARDLSSDQINFIMGKSDVAPVIADVLTLMSISMNMALPQFQKPQVRQAVKWAIDYEAIAKNITPNTWNVWQSCLPKGTPGAIADRPFHRDVARAKALLAEAGYPDGFSVTLDHYATWPWVDIAQTLQADLAAIGIKVQLLAGELKQVVTKLRARRHEISLGRASPDYLDPNSFAQWFCANPDDSDDSKLKATAWRSHFADAELTAAVDAAAKELNEKKRLEIYAKMQRDFMERSPFALLLQQTSIAVQRKGVSGLRLGVLLNYTRYAGIQKA